MGGTPVPPIDLGGSPVPRTGGPARAEGDGPVDDRAAQGARSDLPPVDTQPVLAPPPQPETVLTPDETTELLRYIMGEDESVPFNRISTHPEVFINQLNLIANGSKSSVITASTKARIHEDEQLRETLRLVFWFLLEHPGFSRSKPSMPAAESETPSDLCDFAASVSASGQRSTIQLDPTQLQMFRNGVYTLEVHLKQDDKGQIESFRVILKIGFHSETVAEYKKGEEPQASESPLARATIAYIQRLLIGAGYLGQSGGFEEGVFGKETYYALYSFLANKNLLGFPNIDNARLMLDAKRDRALEDYHKYQAVTGDSDTRRSLRYGLAEKALDSLNAAISAAESYQDFMPENLSKEEQAFITHCQEMAEELRPLMAEIFGEITAKENGLIRLDIRSLKAKVDKLKQYRTNGNTKKEWETFYRLTSTATRVLGKIRKWQRMAQGNPSLYIDFNPYIEAISTLVHGLIEDYPEYEMYMQETLQLLGNALDNLEDNGEEDTDPTTKAAWRFRYRKAHEISDQLGESPARLLLVSFLKSSLLEDSKKDLGTHFQALSEAFGYTAEKATLSFESLGRELYENDVLSNLTGREPKRPGRSYYASDAMSAIGIATRDEDTRNEVYNLLVTLYSVVQEHNAYANSPEGQAQDVQFISFADMIDSAQEVLAALEGANKKDTKEILKILAYTSGNYETADLELAEGLEQRLTKVELKGTDEEGTSQIITITPRALHELEEDYVRASIIDGAVTYEDLERWNPELLETISGEAGKGDYFFISVFGDIEKITSEETLARINSGDLPVIPENNFAGIIYERNPLEFIRIEKVASLKLAITSYVPISDKQVLVLDSTITARLTAKDLEGIITVFGESEHWIFLPSTLDLKPVEISVLKKVADTLENSGQEEDRGLAGLIRRFTKGASKGVRFTAGEKAQLEKFFAELDPGAYEHLNPFEKRHLIAAGEKALFALPLMYHKDGLGKEEQDSLRDLAGFFEVDENLSINDGRLVKDEPSPELTERVRVAHEQAGKTFDEEAFIAAYKKAIEVLRDLHGSLHILASKYPPEEYGYLGLKDFVWTYYKHAGKAMLESIAAPGPSDFIMVGLANEQIYEINVLLYPDLVFRLSQIQEKLYGRVAREEFAGFGEQQDQIWEGLVQAGYIHESGIILPEFDGNSENFEFEIEGFENTDGVFAILEQARLRGYEHLADNTELKEAIGECLKDLAALKALVPELVEDAKKHKKESTVKGLVQDFATLIDYLDDAKDNRAMLVYSARDFLTMTFTLLAKIKQAKKKYKSNPKILAILDKMEKALRDHNGLQAKITQVQETRNELAPEYEDKFDLETERARIIQTLSSDRFDAKKFALLQENLPGITTDSVDMSWLDMPLIDVIPQELWERAGFEFVDWASGVFSGDQGIVVGPGGQSTRLTAREILTSYFEEHPDGSFSLSSLLPHPGEAEETTIAKIALSKLFEQLPREQPLDLLKSLPVMILPQASTHGLFSLARDIPAIGSRLAGGVEVDYGPTNIEELRASTNPGYKLYYSFMSFLALSSSQYPRTNFSSQLHMLMAGSPEGQEYLAQHLSSDNGTQDLKFDTVNAQDVDTFIKYVEEEILPQIERNPRLKSQVEYLLRTRRLSIDFTHSTESTKDDLKHILPSIRENLPEGDFKIYDAAHAPDETRALSQLLEDILKITGEINKTRATEDIELYAMSFFDPIHTVYNTAMEYQGGSVTKNNFEDFGEKQDTVWHILEKTHYISVKGGHDVVAHILPKFDGNKEAFHAAVQAAAGGQLSGSEIDMAFAILQESHVVDPPHHLKVLHYDESLEEGEAIEGFDLWGVGLQPGMHAEDSINWAKINIPKMKDGLIEEIGNDPGAAMVDALRGTAGFATHFMLFMGTQINMGFADTWGGLGDLAAAIERGDKKAMYDAAARMRDGFANTTGAFLVFETIPWIFYGDVIKEIEAGNYSVALGKAIAITALTWKSFGAIVGILKHGVKTGEVVIKNGKIYMSNRQAKKVGGVVRRYMADPEANSLGLKLGWYTLTPTGWAHGAYRIVAAGLGVHSYYTGDYNLTVSRPAVSITPTEPLAPDGWTLMGELRRYRTVDTARSVGQLPRRAGEFVVGRQRNPDAPITRDVDASRRAFQDLSTAKSNPSSVFELTIERGAHTETIMVDGETRTVTYEGSRHTITIKGEMLLELAQARNFKETRAIIERYNANTGQKYTLDVGSMRELHHALGQHRVAFANNDTIANELDMPALDDITPSSTHAFNEFRFLQEATAGRGWGNSFTVEVMELDTAGRPIIHQATGQPRTQTHSLTGQQILEILDNTFGQTGKTVISPEVDGHISQHFQKTVNPVDLQKMMNGIGKQLKNHGTRGYVRGKVEPGFFNRLFGSYTFAEPAYTSWKDFYRDLDGDARIANFAEDKGISQKKARMALAQQLYEEYINQRTDIVMEELNRGARRHLSQSELAEYEAKGRVLEKGTILGRKFQDILGRVSDAITEGLNTHDLNFDVNQTLDDIIRASRAAHDDSRTPTSDDDGRAPASDDDGSRPADDGRRVEPGREQTPRSTSFASTADIVAQAARGDITPVEAARRLYNGDVYSRPELHRALRNADVPGDVERSITREFNEILGDPSRANTPAEDGAPVTEDATTPLAAEDAPTVIEDGPAVIEEGPSTRAVDAAENLGTAVAKGLNTPEGRSRFRTFLGTPKGRLFAQKAMTGASFAVSLLASLGVEELCKLAGMENKAAIFGMGLGAGVIADQAFQRAFVSGFQAGPLGAQVGSLGAGLGFGFLASSMYNGGLDAAGVRGNSWARGTIPEMGVGLGGALLGIHSLSWAPAGFLGKEVATIGGGSIAGGGAGAAAIPFALFAVGNMVPYFTYNDVEFSFRKEVQNDVMMEMAKDSLEADHWYQRGYATYSGIMWSVPILNNFTTWLVDDETIANKAELYLQNGPYEGAPSFDDTLGDAKQRLRLLWSTTDGETLAYNGEAQDISFFTDVEFSTSQIERRLAYPVNFRNYHPVKGVIRDKRMPGDTGPAPSVTIYEDYTIRELDAFDFLTEGNGQDMSPEELAAYLESEFNIQDPARFMERIAIKGLQAEIGYIDQGRQAGDIIGDTRYDSFHKIFRGNGTMRKGTGEELLAQIIDDPEALKASLLENRRTKRMAALIGGEKPTDVDKQLGFVNADGSINEDNEYYQICLNLFTNAMVAQLDAKTNPGNPG